MRSVINTHISQELCSSSSSKQTYHAHPVPRNRLLQFGLPHLRRFAVAFQCRLLPLQQRQVVDAIRFRRAGSSRTRNTLEAVAVTAGAAHEQQDAGVDAPKDGRVKVRRSSSSSTHTAAVVAVAVVLHFHVVKEASQEEMR